MSGETRCVVCSRSMVRGEMGYLECRNGHPVITYHPAPSAAAPPARPAVPVQEEGTPMSDADFERMREFVAKYGNECEEVLLAEVTRLRALAASGAELREAAQVYAKRGHAMWCGIYNGIPQPCDCGLDALRAALRASPPSHTKG